MARARYFAGLVATFLSCGLLYLYFSKWNSSSWGIGTVVKNGTPSSSRPSEKTFSSHRAVSCQLTPECNKKTGSPYKVWPIPIEMRTCGERLQLHEDFNFKAISVSSRLDRAIIRTLSWLKSRAGSKVRSSTGLKQIEVYISSRDETLTAGTSHAYNLTICGSRGNISADTVYGAIYGLETFNQLLVRGKAELEFRNIIVRDYPRHQHRGLMIDAGRRFFPLPLMKKILDGMSFFKFSVMHFHMLDYGGFAMESELYPHLAKGSNGYLTKNEVKGLIEYAKDRGIRVVPEVDLPGHSKGLSPLADSGDVVFCGTGRIQVKNDPKGLSIKSLKKLLSEMIKFFPDEVFHVGADETGANDRCPMYSIIQFEKEIMKHVQSEGKMLASWEESRYVKNSAPAKSIIYTWRDHQAKHTTSEGFYAVESNMYNFYLDYIMKELPPKKQWIDISAGVKKENSHLLLGGEVSMWTDNWCYVTQCFWDITKRRPMGKAMWNRTRDDAFATSIQGMIWPRAAIGAGSFWNFDASLQGDSKEFDEVVKRQAEWLVEREVATCPPGCLCDQLTQCGKPIPGST